MRPDGSRTRRRDGRVARSFASVAAARRNSACSRGSTARAVCPVPAPVTAARLAWSPSKSTSGIPPALSSRRMPMLCPASVPSASAWRSSRGRSAGRCAPSSLALTEVRAAPVPQKALKRYVNIGTSSGWCTSVSMSASRKSSRRVRSISRRASIAPCAAPAATATPQLRRSRQKRATETRRLPSATALVSCRSRSIMRSAPAREDRGDPSVRAPGRVWT